MLRNQSNPEEFLLRLYSMLSLLSAPSSVSVLLFCMPVSYPLHGDHLCPGARLLCGFVNDSIITTITKVQDVTTACVARPILLVSREWLFKPASTEVAENQAWRVSDAVSSRCTQFIMVSAAGGASRILGADTWA